MFHRTAEPLTAVKAEGCWIYDSDRREYLDAASGAIVSSIGHGDRAVLQALSTASLVDYVHPSVFTTNTLERYADAVAGLVPVDGAKVFPTSGGAESVETALKLARAYHLSRGQDRSVVVSRRQSYHGNTLGALRVSGRQALREPYEPWLGGAVMVPEVNEYRCPNPGHPDGCAAWHADRLEEAFQAVGAGKVAAFIGETIGGATLGAAVPPDGYWESIGEVCRRHGVLLIVDEVMTGFGRTGSWFAIEKWDVRPDILVSGKGAAAGYWPLGLCFSSSAIHEAVTAAGGFVHGFTFSHGHLGAAVGMAVLERILEDDLVAAASRSGERLLHGLGSELADSQVVGDVRGRGLLVGIEFVRDRETREPFPRSDRFVERLTAACRGNGLLVYPSTGCADGVLGDSILIGPPLTCGEAELDMIVDRLGRSLREVAP